MKPLPGDVAALRAGGKPALARTLSALETEPGDLRLAELLDAAFAAPRALVLGLTGPPGVGKSTLASALIARLRARGESVGVIAVDPSSRRSGGALLGDRTRIATDPADQGVFLRSMAARSRLGGLAELTFPAAVLMRALFDRVIIETVGVGQSETEIAGCADLVVFCAQPGAGDALQFMKAGVTEIPDLVLVTKGDLGPPAERAAADLRGALSLMAEGGGIGVAIVSSLTGAGLDAALACIARRGAALGAGPLQRRRRDQAMAWIETRLVESFGTEGAAIFGRPTGLSARPFTGFANIREQARAALNKALQDM